MITDAQMPEMDGFTLAARIRENPETARTLILMLTSAGQRGDGARCRQLGLAGYLVKPVWLAQLHQAILSVRSGMLADGKNSYPLVTRHSLRENRERLASLRILVAEDNPVNQEVIRRLLEKRGCSLEVVGTGSGAVAAFNQEHFHLVLMDVQMPEMSGYEAVAAIRACEKETGSHTPIIALTAHAMKGDREKCLAAGMDGYITKPVQPKELLAMVENATSKLALHPSAVAHEPSVVCEPIA
ncbi:MAG: response regulator [Terriglobia bacterium]